MVNQTKLLHKIYCGSVESRLAFGIHLFKTFGPTLERRADVLSALALMRSRERALSTHMQSQMLGRLCSACAASECGGCCSRYMAGETDSLQIVMNLLAGVEVAQINEHPAECCYLNPAAGCIFLFKPMFCLNYNCRRIEESVSGKELSQLEREAAALLRSQYALEGVLQRFLSSDGVELDL